MINKASDRILYLSIFVVILMTFLASSGWSATISGTVKIEGKQDISGVLITVQEKNLSGITNKNGSYSIKDVPSGSYTLTAQKPGCLVAVISDVLVNGATTTVDFQLTQGDLKIDNQINLLDRIALVSVWRSKVGDANWDSMFDLYEDGVIDEKDRDLLLSGWRKGNANIKLVPFTVESEPSGASILINGADTGKVTPYTFRGIIAGKYNVKLTLENYPIAEYSGPIPIDEKNSPLTRRLDNDPPEISNWAKDPDNLTEDTIGRFRVSVRVTDVGGSGMGDKVPQFDYHIGTNTVYTGYKDMKSEGNDIWYYEILEPLETWDAYRGKYIYYKVKAEDAAGNSGESTEQQELIDDINDAPTVRIASTFSAWEKGLLTIGAEASDSDGSITGVKFEYSLDNVNWKQIGLTDTQTPYSVAWDTKTVIEDVMKNVWLRATATDNDSKSVTYVIPSTFGIDNQPPTTTHDYDRTWHNTDFTITLRANDGSGIGVSTISYILNSGTKQDIQIDGQAFATVVIAKEGQTNTLEYWSVDKLGNEESHKTLANIMLDKTPPSISNWTQDPPDLTEDSSGRFRVMVQVTDEGGSGITGKVPQFDYHIGSGTQYDGYENMLIGNGTGWYFDIPEPLETWDSYRGEYIYYKVRSEDIAVNVRESAERRELIDDINDPPTVNIKSVFDLWEKGVLTIDASASDTDGTISGVQFEYSFDQTDWKPIGPIDASEPYSIEWDTATSILQARTAWIRATAVDNDGASVAYVYPTGVGIDNQPPTTSDDYDDLWKRQNFTIKLTADDGNGIGISNVNIKYRLNEGDVKNILSDGQPLISNEGINKLEYWGIDNLGNEEIHHVIPNIKLDKTAPVIGDWVKDPVDLTEDSIGPLRISVRVTDSGGSGLTGKVPKFSYRIGRDAQYSEYANMMSGETPDVWYYDIIEPAESWDAYRGKYIYYKVSIEDVAGNKTESPEQQELIDDINDAPTVRITSSFSEWETGSIEISAVASDTDGSIASVVFDYSEDKVSWIKIGTLTMTPYSIIWDSKSSIPEVSKTVWIKAISTDDDGLSVEHTITNSFKIDNQPPITSHDYDGLWHIENFVINLTAGDKNGIGVSSISYKLNDGEVQEVPITGNAGVPVTITKEGLNTLEYWSVDRLGNEETPKTLTNIRLDKTPSVFSDWKQDPVDLTEDTTRRFRVSVVVTDAISGLTGKIPQIDYHIGTDTRYDGYENMLSDDGKLWYFDIPQPEETWNAHRGKNIYYKVKSTDVAGNTGESAERSELIDSINDPPVVALTSTFKQWETGQITIEAEASDVDGSVPTVQFEYSTDGTTWTAIPGATSTPPTYSVKWNTKTSIPELAESVWVRAVATDADDDTVSVISEISEKFGVDNKPPIAGTWTKSPENLTEDTTTPLRVTVSFDDTPGSGVQKVEIAYRIGTIINRDFRDMKRESGNIWYYEIQDTGTWDDYRGQILYYKARATDAVGNVSQVTDEQQELIDDINDPPLGSLTSSFKNWERESIFVQADAVDEDGEVETVKFQYSTDNINWIDIGTPLTRPPYIVTWNTTVIVSDPEVWVKAIITDDDQATTEVTIPRSFGIDNKAPVLANWKLTPADLNESSIADFLSVEVEITDVGSGLDNSKVLLDYRMGQSAYTGYKSMFKGTGNSWFYEIPRPVGGWGSLAGQRIYYKAQAFDIAGNFTESEEKSEFIEPTTGVISGTISPRDSWRGAKVVVQQNNQKVTEATVSQIDGSYTVTGLSQGSYDLVITAVGYGTDKSQTGIEVKAGEITKVDNIELYTYAVETISAVNGGKVDFRDKDLKDYSLTIERNTFLQDSKVVLGFGGDEPTGIPNPTVHLMGKSIGIGFQGQTINQPLKLVVPRPEGITDEKAIMVFVYNGIDYRFVNKKTIAQTDTTVTIYITPPDVQGFTDPNHSFDKVLSRTTDTVFYVVITRFDEPQFSLFDLGIREPVYSSGQLTYNSPNISSSAKTIALLIHGITSRSSDFLNLISDLKALKQPNSTEPYYNYVLVFNYESGINSLNSNSLSLMTEFGRILPSGFNGKIDVIAHGKGGLVARHAINNRGGDQYIGSLTMLATPHNGVNADLLRSGFTRFLKKTQSDPTWTYYRDGWQEIMTGSQALASLNSQLGKAVQTHYYAIAASNPNVVSDSENNDGLLYVDSANFKDNTLFPSLEQPLTEAFEKVSVSAPTIAGTGFMTDTRHVAVINSFTVRGKITAFLQGKSGDITVEEHDIDLIPGNRIEQFKVVLKNIGTDTVYGVTGLLSTNNSYIRKYSGTQGLEKSFESFGDIPSNSTKTGFFSFDVSSSATEAIGEQITFSLLIRNARDNSINIEQFTVPIGGNLIQIALDNQGLKRVVKDVSITEARTENDGDIAVEPGETMRLDITLENRSSSAIQSVTATLRTDDTRVIGLIPTTTGNVETNMATEGITVDYGMIGSLVATKSFRFVRVKSDFTPLGDRINFTLDIKSGTNLVGRDEFAVRVGADIAITEVDVDDRLKPGGPTEDIDITIRNTTLQDISNVEVRIDTRTREVSIPDYRETFNLLRAGQTDTAVFPTSIDAGFAGYVEFTLDIRAGGRTVNFDKFRHYFGKRTHYILDWIADDNEGTYSDKIAEPGETIEFQLTRRNPTNEIAQDVEVTIDTTDTSIVKPFIRSSGDYRDILANSTGTARRDYEFEILKAGDLSYNAPSGSVLSATRLELTGAKWMPDAFIGGTLNPNTTTGETQYTFNIIDNGTNWIEVEAGSDMLDPNGDGIDDDDPHDGDPFRITVGDAFRYKGRIVPFTLAVEENGEIMGQETYDMRIGGIIRYSPPQGYQNLLANISDATTLSTANNGNGIPEPGETIEIKVKLINISNITDVDNVVAELDPLSSDVDAIIDEFDYGRIRKNREVIGTFRVKIDSDFEDHYMILDLFIEGDIGASTKDLGKDTFRIPVKQNL